MNKKHTALIVAALLLILLIFSGAIDLLAGIRILLFTLMLVGAVGLTRVVKIWLKSRNLQSDQENKGDIIKKLIESVILIFAPILIIYSSTT